MERLIVEGGSPLSGEIMPAGNKNSAQPMLAACLLTDKPITLHNVPDIADIRVLLQILEGIGVEVEASRLSTTHTITLQAKTVSANPTVILAHECAAQCSWQDLSLLAPAWLCWGSLEATP